tara:strand:+ start:232 stop:522 length:291 start_codon:yes stop_codon:yes gene_type:complete
MSKFGDKLKLKRTITTNVDTNKQRKFDSNRELSKKRKILKQKDFDKKVADQKKDRGTVGPSRKVEQAQAAARLNPVSGPIANIVSAVKGKKKKKKA